MNQVIETIKSRRSIRKYKSEQIKDSDLEEILEAAKYSASGHGYQSTLMVVVQNKEILAKLSKMNASIMGREGIDPFYGAPTVVIVFADKTKPTHVSDGALVLGNLMLAAKSLNIGSCWINRAKEEFESLEGKELMKEWNIDEHFEGIGHVTLGYAASEPTAAPRKEDFVRYIR